MKSITVHNLEESIYEKMKTKADELGMSMGKYIRGLISKDLGVSGEKPRYDLSFLKDVDVDELGLDEIEKLTKEMDALSMILDYEKD